MSFSKTRLDDYLVQAGFALDRKAALALILSGQVRLRGNLAKPGDVIDDPTLVQLLSVRPFVSRGGEKLQGALAGFKLSPKGQVCLDLGSSTGGFTDCLLKAGAKEVWATDVGQGLFDQQLGRDPRVHLLEGIHFANLDLRLFQNTRITFATVDVSFISISKLFPTLIQVLENGSDVLALIKPQFEATPKEAPGGFVRDEPTRQMILERVRSVLSETAFEMKGSLDAVITGRGGNQETFYWLRKPD